ncbi:MULTISPECIES: hypothetical protein [Streptomyces]|nr:hypothetical protein [Streptomyces sp. NEAU-383]
MRTSTAWNVSSSQLWVSTAGWSPRWNTAPWWALPMSVRQTRSPSLVR